MKVSCITLALVGIVMILSSTHSIVAQKQKSDRKKKNQKKEIGNDTLYVEAGKIGYIFRYFIDPAQGYYLYFTGKYQSKGQGKPICSVGQIL